MMTVTGVNLESVQKPEMYVHLNNGHFSSVSISTV